MGLPPQPLLLAGSKMELLGEACGIWDLQALAEGKDQASMPQSTTLYGGQVALQIPVTHSCD